MESENRARVLIVDDEDELQKSLVLRLGCNEFDAEGYSSATEALEVLEHKEFDVLLTDLMMPEMDGIDLIRESLTIDPYLTCILMTGQGTIETAEKGLKTGAFDYLQKPFKIPQLLTVLERGLKMSRTAVDNRALRETVEIYRLSQVVAFNSGLQPLLEQAVDGAARLFGAGEVSIMLVDEDTQELVVALARGNRRDSLVGSRQPLDQGIAGWVAIHHEPLILHNSEMENKFTDFPELTRELYCCLCAPMMARNSAIAATKALLLGAASIPVLADDYYASYSGAVSAFGQMASDIRVDDGLIGVLDIECATAGEGSSCSVTRGNKTQA